MNPSFYKALGAILVTIFVLLFGFDLIAKSGGFQAEYRRAVRWMFNFFRRHVSRFVRFAWREYKQFIVGAVAGSLATLYFLGRLGI